MADKYLLVSDILIQSIDESGCTVKAEIHQAIKVNLDVEIRIAHGVTYLKGYLMHPLIDLNESEALNIIWFRFGRKHSLELRLFHWLFLLLFLLFILIVRLILGFFSLLRGTDRYVVCAVSE